MPQYDNGPAGEPESRGRRAPGGAWGQLSEEARDELTRPLRVESGRTGSPGEDQLQGQPDHRDLRRGGPRLPEPGEEPAEGGGEPGTIERPRVRARLADQGERARPPGGGTGRDPMPPFSPRGSGAGSSEAESAGSGEAPPGLSAPSGPMGLADGGGAEGPPPRKRHQKRLQRQWGDARKASKRPNQTEDSP